MPVEEVELHARSAFSFLRGASFPEHLAEKAAELRLRGMALVDRDGLYGAPPFFAAAKDCNLRSIVGAELTFADGSVLPILVKNQTGYRNLCKIITQAKLRGTKQDAPVNWSDFEGRSEGLMALTGDEEGAVRRAIQSHDFVGAKAFANKLVSVFGPKDVCIEVQRRLVRGEDRDVARLFELAGENRRDVAPHAQHGGGL